jgi:hypothetical protein
MPAEPLYFLVKPGRYCCSRMDRDFCFRWVKVLISHSYGMKEGLFLKQIVGLNWEVSDKQD